MALDGGHSAGSCGILGQAVGVDARWLNLAAVRTRNACQLATSSSMESPPNFSITASASTMATMASPTTAAAGPAQTSLRSMAAGPPALGVKSTERNGLISV